MVSPTKTKSITGQQKNQVPFLYGYRKLGTRARMFFRTLIKGNIKIETT